MGRGLSEQQSDILMAAYRASRTRGGKELRAEYGIDLMRLEAYNDLYCGVEGVYGLVAEPSATAALSRSLRRLEARGLVVRVARRREQYAGIRLTHAGQSLAAACAGHQPPPDRRPTRARLDTAWRPANLPRGVLYIGRAWSLGDWRLPASKWANRHNWKVLGREVAIARYEADVRSDPALMAALPELRGQVLACWCELDEPCHADVLIRLVDERTV